MTRKSQKQEPIQDARERHAAGNPMAVIDIGTTSVRMAVAQVQEDGRIQTLESLQQAVSLGKDTFTKGVLEPATVAECVQALRSFRKILNEYGITDPHRIRAVATSAVREAANRDQFLDRIYIATGLEVEAIDEAELNRLTYFSVKPVLDSEPVLQTSNVLIVEVGGGSTEMLGLRRGRVSFSHTYRLGSLRLREMLEDYRAPTARFRAIIESHLDRTLDQVRGNPALRETKQMLIMGGDARFAVTQLTTEWRLSGLAHLDVAALDGLCKDVLSHSVDDLVRRHRLSYPDAETLAPALLIYLRLAQALGLSRLLVTSISMRDGLLAEIATEDAWAGEFSEQILHSARVLGKKYQVNEPHTHRVAEMCRHLFQALRDEHQLGPRYESMLTVAALLHEIGFFVSNQSHHKHSMYLILNSNVFGLGARDLLLTALIARYHRRATPKPSHEGYSDLDRESRIIVAKLAAILRVADALDRSHSGRIVRPRVTIKDQELVLSVANVTDLTLERLALDEKGPMFEQVYGLRVVLHKRNSGK